MNAYRQIKKSPIELIKAIEELDGNMLGWKSLLL